MSDEGTPWLFDLPEGRRRRDEGMERVSGHNKRWMNLSMDAATDFAMKRTGDFTGEDIRFHCITTVGYPGHHNAWGSLINHLIRNRIIVATGEHRPMRDKTSHARSTPVYVALRL